MSGFQEIDVRILPDGQVQIEVRGVHGEGCRDLTRELERYLGGRVVHRRHTDEFQRRRQREEDSTRNRVGRK
jgi:hypothetical protein